MSDDIAVLRKKAEQGDAAAQFELGDAYFLGQGIDLDYDSAIKWYMKSAEQGNADAEFALGFAHTLGAGVGNAAAQNSMGCSYYWGQGVEQDYTEAVKWLRMAADQGKGIALFNLGNAYAEGHGVERDYRKALSLYEAALDKGTMIARGRIQTVKELIAEEKRKQRHNSGCGCFGCVILAGIAVFVLIDAIHVMVQ